MENYPIFSSSQKCDLHKMAEIEIEAVASFAVLYI